MTRGLRATAAALLACTAWLGAGLFAPAAADPSLPELTAQATTLRHRLDELAVQQGLAVEAYDTAVEAVQQATTAQVLADTALSGARRAVSKRGADDARRARALYMSGGSVGLTATVLDSADLTDVLTRWQAVEALVRDDAPGAVTTTSDLTTARRASADAGRARAQTAAQRVAADQAVAAVRASIEARAELLARTDATVVELAGEQQRVAEAAALANAAESARQQGIATAAEPAAVSREPARTTVTRAPVSTPPPSTSAAPRPSPIATPRATPVATPRATPVTTPRATPVATPVAPPDGPPVDTAASRAIAAARTRLGKPYVWGATGPDSFDCSGLTGWAYRQAGISIPRTSREQYAALPRVPLAQLRPGDLVFYASSLSDPGTIHHVGIYIGGGLSLYAPQTGDVVKIGAVRYENFIGAVRPSAS